ncbi:MAG: hypothetical protein ACK42Z_07895 [Candidatus Kapaibacteriota bacterium]
MELNRNIEQIIEYLDGELPVTEEQELFSALVESEALRNAMRDYLTISRAIRFDTVSFQPPPVATLNILTKLGFNNNDYLNPPFQNTKSFSSKMKKFVLPILIALVSSLGTFLGTYFYFTKNQPVSDIPRAIVQAPPIIISSLHDEDNIAPANNNISFNTYTRRSANQDSEAVVARSLQNSGTEPMNYILESHRFKANALNENNLIKDNSQNEFYQTTFQQDRELFKFNASKPKDIFFTFRGIIAKSFPDPDIVSKGTDKLFANLSAGLYFTQWDNIKFGIEFGNEIFGLNYQNIKDGIEFTYEQKPNLYWAAAGVDYTFPKELMQIANIHPFATILAGGSQIGGPLLKGLFGLRYRPHNSNFEIYLATEGTLLFYQNQKKSFLSRKFGLTYGISVVF